VTGCVTGAALYSFLSHSDNYGLHTVYTVFQKMTQL